MLELEQIVRQLEARLAVVNNSNEELQLELDESNHFIYDRGPVAEEMQNLRHLNRQNIQEIQRINMENEALQDSVRRAQAIVPNAGRRHQRHLIGHPELERATITQNAINHLFERSRNASLERP